MSPLLSNSEEGNSFNRFNQTVVIFDFVFKLKQNLVVKYAPKMQSLERETKSLDYYVNLSNSLMNQLERFLQNILLRLQSGSQVDPKVFHNSITFLTLTLRFSIVQPVILAQGVRQNENPSTHK